MPRTTLTLSIAAAAALLVPGIASAELPPAHVPQTAALATAGLSVDWPLGASEQVVVGNTVEVAVRRMAHRSSRAPRARVSLVRVDVNGRPMRTSARPESRNGTFALRLPGPVGAHYALRLDLGHRRYWSWITAVAPAATGPSVPIEGPAPACPAEGHYGAEMQLDPASGRSGDVLSISIVNTGTSCLSGSMHRWEQRGADDAWQTVPGTEHGHESLGPYGDVIYPAGIAFSANKGNFSLRVPDGLSAGTYRFVETIGTVTLTAAFDVLP